MRNKNRYATTTRWAPKFIRKFVPSVSALFFLLLLAWTAPVVFKGWSLRQVLKTPIGEHIEGFSSQCGVNLEISPVLSSNGRFHAERAAVTFPDGSHATAFDLDSQLDWNSYLRGIWNVIETRIRRIEVFLAGDGEFMTFLPSLAQVPEAAEAGSVSAWFKPWQPKRLATNTVDIQRLDIHGPNRWELLNASLRIDPWCQGDAVVSGGLCAGVLRIPAGTICNRENQCLQLERAKIQLSEDACHWQNVVLRQGAGRLNLDACLQKPAQAWQLQTRISNLAFADWLPKPWCFRLSGCLSGEVRLDGNPQGPVRYRGKLCILQGGLKELPQLHRIASWTGLTSLRQLAFDTAEAEISGNAEEWRLENLVLASKGVMRLEGSLAVRGEKLDGRFWLGLAPETLRLMPDASQHVFSQDHPEASPGLRWTQVRLSGTLGDPSEDLSPRLLEKSGLGQVDLLREAAERADLMLEPVIGDSPEDMTKALENVLQTGKNVRSSAMQLLGNLGMLLQNLHRTVGH